MPFNAGGVADDSWTFTSQVEDLAGNVSAVESLVVVYDSTAPTLTPPATQTAEATSALGATVGYPAATLSELGSISYSRASGTLFPIGTTTVTVDGADLAGNAATQRSFTVTVVDTTPPTITSVSPNLIREATSAAGALVTYAAATATDLTGIPTITYSKASNTTFGIGTTTVTVSATDAYGNVATRTFTVLVRDTIAPVVTVAAPVAGTSYDIGISFAFSYTATDAVGVVSRSATLDGASIANGATITTSTLSIGSHTIVVTARDGAGNIGTRTVTFGVHATPAGLKDAVASGVASSLIATQMQNPLTVKLTAIQADLAAGNVAQARLDLQSFISQVNAQSGKKIDAAYAAKLIAWAQDLLARL